MTNKIDLNANITNSVYCPACEKKQSLSSVLIGGDICTCECGEIIHTRRVARCDSCKKKIKLTLCDAEGGEILCGECTEKVDDVMQFAGIASGDTKNMTIQEIKADMRVLK